MQLGSLIVIIVLILSLLIQAINFAAMGYAIQGYNYYDTLNAGSVVTSTMLQQNIGYIVFVLIATAISCLIYIYLILSKVLSFTFQSLDWWCYVIVINLQFAIAVIFAVDLKNYQTNYSLLSALLSPMTVDPYVTVWNYFKTIHALMIAASVLTFAIGFCGGLFTVGRKTMELKTFLSTTVNTELKDQSSIGKIEGGG